MPKEIIFEQRNPKLGLIKGVLRIVGRIIFLKFNNLKYSKDLISQMKLRGAKVVQGRNWIRVDMFHNKENVKLGNNEFNVKEKSDDEMELILYNFYLNQYIKSGFKIISK